jgi:stage II sporulation protein D
MSLATLSLVLGLGLAEGIVEDLYSHRLLFDDRGRPVVPVGMMQGAARVVVEAESGLVVTVPQASGAEARLEVPPRTPLIVEKGTSGGGAAVVEELWVLETLEGEDRARKREAAAQWRSRGVDVEILDVGGVYGVKGTVVDNRAALLVVRAAPAGGARDRALLEKLEKLGARPALVERLLKAPSLEVRAGKLRGTAVRLAARGRGGILVRDVEHSVGYADHGFADRVLRGEVVVAPDKKGGLAVVNLVDEDALVAGVLPSEMFATAPIEALKAQAVTARGELFAKIGRRHFADPHLVCSEQHCQVYKGVTAEHPRANQAAEETRGELAFVDGRLVDSVYSACCGGHTEAADAVWDRPPHSALAGRVDAPLADPHSRPWLQPSVEGSAFAARAAHGAGAPAVPLDLRREEAVRAFLALPRQSAFCGRSSFNQKGDAWRWERRFTSADLDAAFADLGVGEVRALRIDERGPGGRLRALVIEGSKKSARVLRELPVRRRFGNLRSGLFVIDEERGPDGRLVAVVLRGAGFGHGSGMCQQGAIGMAEAGYDYRQILRHYYAGAEVRKVF